MRYGYWLPVFGGWLRNVEDEDMEASWDYVKRLAQRSEEIGYDITLVAELLLNDIKGIEAPSLDAWSTAAALAAVTRTLELMVAVRPSFHPPAILAKQAANIDRISNGRLALNVVSAWWKDEARRYGVAFDEHDDRYARTSEWLDVVSARGARRSSTIAGSTTRSTIWFSSRSPFRVRSVRVRRSTPAASRRRRSADRAPVRRVRHARRSAGAHRAEDRGHASPARTGERSARYRAAAAAIRRCRVCDRARQEAEVREEIARITKVAPGSPGYGNYQTGSQTRSSSSASASRITRCRIAVFARG